MALEARGAAVDSASCRAGGEAQGDVDDPHRASGRGRAEDLDNTTDADGSRGQTLNSGGDGTRRSDGNIGRRRSSLDRTGEEDEDSRSGTWVGTGSTDHRSIRSRSIPGTEMD